MFWGTLDKILTNSIDLYLERQPLPPFRRGKPVAVSAECVPITSWLGIAEPWKALSSFCHMILMVG